MKSKTKVIYNMPVRSKKVLYRNAEKLAKVINLDDAATYCFLDGSFIYGDFIEALFVENNLYTKELTISTLSMSENNVYNLRNLVEGGYVGKINLIISDYFYSHEKWKLIKLLTNEVKSLKIFSVRTHTKIMMFECEKGKIVIQGSANMRTSGNFENIIINNDEDVFDFSIDFHKQMTKGFGETKNKNIDEEKQFQNLEDYTF